MTPNPFTGLLHSRKFWVAVMDAIGAILALWLGSYAPEQMAVLIMATWAAIQPVLVIVIAAIAYEDKAAMEASARINAAAAFVVAPPDIGENCDEQGALRLSKS